MEGFMIRLMTSAAILCFLLAALSSPGQARVAFVQDRSFTVPGLTTIQYMKIRPSIDGASLLVLATDGNKLILHDASRDSVELQVQADSVFLFYEVELADVTRDSVLDACAIEYNSELEFGWSTEVTLNVYRSCDSLSRRSRILDSGFQEGISGFYNRSGGIGVCDLDNDGYDELLTSVGTMFAQMIGPCEEESSIGKTLIYQSAPDTVRDSLTGTVNEVHDLPLGSGSMSYAITTPSYYYSELGDDRLTQSTTINALTTSSLTTELAATRAYGAAWGCSSVGENDNYTSFGCVGHIVTNNTSSQLLTKFDGSTFCPGEAPSASGSRLELRQLQSPTQATLLWSRDITGTNYSNFMYHPQLPGYFFGFSGDTLLMFNGSDGSIKDRLADVPSGTRHWDTPYNDSIPRLVVTSGATVSLYHLDIATGVDDNNQAGSVPASFTLGNPYPNPFNPSTTVEFNLPKRGEVTVTIFNILGQPVRILAQETLAAGEHSITWDGTNDAGHGVASGVYLCQVETATQRATAKMLLLR
jgi:hypothetical protein